MELVLDENFNATVFLTESETAARSVRESAASVSKLRSAAVSNVTSSVGVATPLPAGEEEMPADTADISDGVSGDSTGNAGLEGGDTAGDGTGDAGLVGGDTAGDGTGDAGLEGGDLTGDGTGDAGLEGGDTTGDGTGDAGLEGGDLTGDGTEGGDLTGDGTGDAGLEGGDGTGDAGLEGGDMTDSDAGMIDGDAGMVGGDMIDGDMGMMGDGMDMMEGATTPKDPLLSSWPFVIGISALVLAVGVGLGVLWAKLKIKKGIDLYED